MRSSTRHTYSVHPCLIVDEIVRLVARELVASEAYRTALALACCCKGYEAPVMDVVWRAHSRLASITDPDGQFYVSASKSARPPLTHLENRPP
jgi:hypothetical protein